MNRRMHTNQIEGRNPSCNRHAIADRFSGALIKLLVVRRTSVSVTGLWHACSRRSLRSAEECRCRSGRAGKIQLKCIRCHIDPLSCKDRPTIQQHSFFTAAVRSLPRYQEYLVVDICQLDTTEYQGIQRYIQTVFIYRELNRQHTVVPTLSTGFAKLRSYVKSIPWPILAQTPYRIPYCRRHR